MVEKKRTRRLKGGHPASVWVEAGKPDSLKEMQGRGHPNADPGPNVSPPVTMSAPGSWSER